MIRQLLIALLSVLAATAANAEDLLADAEDFLSNDRFALATKRYNQVLRLDPEHPFALLRLRQIFLIERAYATYQYERARIEGNLSLHGWHHHRSGEMEPLEPGLSEVQVDGIREAWTKYREERIVILQLGG